jgi:Ni/Co efflux regulator RcnB
VQVQAQPQPQAPPQVVRTESGDRRGIPANGARGGADRPAEVRTTESGSAAQIVRPERRPEPRLSGPIGEAVAGAKAAARRDHPEWDRDGQRDGQRDGDRNSWSRNDRKDSDARNDPNRNRNGGGRDGDNDRDHDRNGWSRDGGRGGWDNNHRGPSERPPWASPDGRWDRDHDRNRYDPRRYPHIWKNTHRYRVSTYYAAPFDYYDHGWNFGEYLPWGWYGPSYWIDDWFAYGLPPPPIGCEWVRVGRDAILVDTFTGQVISVARLLFW